MRSTCTALRRNSTPCAAPALASGYCFAHDPALAAKRDAARVAGGHGKASAARVGRLVPTTLRPLLAYLLNGIEEVHAGTLSPAQATAMASLAHAAIKIFETCELTERLEKLEAVANGPNGY
jgi:hypothetical protein